jgi:phosphatidylserine/phosphatidylglycerophosphate/cardiolipin synthase-like enzyme
MTYAKSIIALLCLVTFAGQPTAAANQVADNWTTGGEINIRDRLDTRQQFTNDGQILFRPDITNVERFTGAVDRLPTDTRRQAVDFIRHLDPHVPQRILMPMVHWRFIEPDTGKYQRAVAGYLQYRLLVVRDAVDDPRSTESERRAALRHLERMIGRTVDNTAGLYAAATPAVESLAAELATAVTTEAFVDILKSRELTATNLDDLAATADYSLSWLGFIPGNHVELISENERHAERINWLNDRVIFNGGTLDWDADHMRMPEGPDDPGGHICFKQDPMFMRIREMIDSAEDSIFIDIFLFGGTLGGTIAKYLIDQTVAKRRDNPGFRCLILHDFATNYNMKPEMMPVFEYIRDRINDARAQGGDTGVVLLQANILRHPPGIPFGLSNLVPRSPVTFAVIERHNTYYESKIDHSKVIVVDANTDSPQAYFGSKNWTDHSGGYYFDDAIYIKGPAAALVQASYYDDVDAALTVDPIEQQWFFYKECGFDNSAWLDRRDELLDWIRIRRDSFPAAGDDVVRISEANVDGRIRNSRNMLVDMIRRAESNVYIEQLFIYDAYVVDALIKRRRQRPDLDVRVIADHNGNFMMNGFPNTMFLRELDAAGIPVRARNTLGIDFTFPDGTRHTFHQENHRKIMSVDGSVLLAGSSNLNPDTLQGSFREFGAQIFNRAEIATFESVFRRDWADDKATGPLVIDGWQMSFRSKVMPPETSALVNDIAAWLVRSKDRLERRE